MEQYSHDQFLVTGTVTTIPNQLEEARIIAQAWEDFKQSNLFELVIDKAYQSLHAIYFNYTNPQDETQCGYDMLIGYLTNSVTNNPDLTTVTIPAQQYRYIVLPDCEAPTIQQGWKTINNMSQQELDRSYQYELEMYNEDFTTTTIAVGVK